MRDNGRPKSKYALVIVTDNGYLRGANATINAMDYYGNTMDLIVIYELISDEYVDSVLAADLNYRIEFIHYDEIKDEFYKDCPGLWVNRFNYCCYVRHWYIEKYLRDYKAVGIIESDAILLDNIVPWFEFAEGTDKLLTAYHVFQSFEIENYQPKDMDFCQPLYIHPLICDPNQWADFFKMIIHIADTRPHIVDMMAMNQAVLLCNKVDKVVVLSDPEWLGGWIYHRPITDLRLLNGRRHMVTIPSRSRIKMLHGKYYGDGFRYNVHNSLYEEDKPVFFKNMEIVLDYYKFFNDQLKVKLPSEARLDLERNLL